MPHVLKKLLELAEEEAKPEVWSDLICRDPGLTCQMVGAASRVGPCSLAGEAPLEKLLAMLGQRTVRALLVDASFSQLQEHDLDPRAQACFWKQACLTGITARMLAHRIGYPHEEEAYLAGLLHDIGRVTTSGHVPQYAGACHAEAGAALVEHWRLDSFLADGIRYQDAPAARLARAHPLIRIVAAARALSNHCDHGAHRAERNADMSRANLISGVPVEELAALGAEAGRQVASLAERFGIDSNIDTGVDLGVDRLDPGAAGAARPMAAMKHGARAQLARALHGRLLAGELAKAFEINQGEAVLPSMLRAARLLLRLDDAIVLLADDEALHGKPVGQGKKHVATFVLPYAAGGLIVEAALQRLPAIASRSAMPLSIPDEQVFRLLHAEHLLLLPLVHADRLLGVMIGAVAPRDVPRFGCRRPLFASFAAEAAAALHRATLQHRAAQREVEEITARYEQASRRVAHEANNPLSIIKNYLAVLDRKLTNRDQVSEELSILHEEIDRVAQILNTLPNLYAPARRRSAEIGQIVEEVVRLFRSTEYAPPSVRVIVRSASRPMAARVDGDALKQALINLIKNAIEALGDMPGEILVDSSELVNRDGRMYAAIRVEDSGPGIPPDLMAALFSPVQSTKGSEHRGLGLSIAHELVSKMGGLLSCRCGQNSTVFEILLPVPEAHHPAAAPTRDEML